MHKSGDACILEAEDILTVVKRFPPLVALHIAKIFPTMIQYLLTDSNLVTVN